MFFVYVNHRPLCSFLSLDSALEACWPYWQEHRSAYVVKVPFGTRRDQLPGYKQALMN